MSTNRHSIAHLVTMQAEMNAVVLEIINKKGVVESF